MKASPSVILRIALWVLFLGGGTLASPWLDRRWFPGWPTHPGLRLGGLLLGLVLTAAILRVAKVTGHALARHGREGDLPRMETNRLVTQGPYTCMRHPMHLAFLFLPLALALILGSPSFVLIVAPTEALVMLAMIFTLEEREAQAKFREAYAAYRRQVPAFDLRAACLRRLFRTEGE